MIFGDPHKFAILVEKVSDWTVPGSYENGIFHFIIDSRFFPDYTLVSTVGSDIGVCLSEKNALLNPVEDDLLFGMPKDQAFTEMMDAVYPLMLNPDKEISDDLGNDFRYRASTLNIQDGGCYVFAVASEDMIRILGAKVNYLSGNPIDGYEWEMVKKIEVYETCQLKKDVLDIVEAVKSQIKISR